MHAVPASRHPSQRYFITKHTYSAGVRGRRRGMGGGGRRRMRSRCASPESHGGVATRRESGIAASHRPRKRRASPATRSTPRENDRGGTGGPREGGRVPLTYRSAAGIAANRTENQRCRRRRSTVISDLHTTPANWGGATAVESISVRSYRILFAGGKKRRGEKGETS